VVFGKFEALAGGQVAHAGDGAVRVAVAIGGVEVLGGAAGAFLPIVPGIGAGRVVVGGGHRIGPRCAGSRGYLPVIAVVPAGVADGCGAHAPVVVPVLDGVLRFCSRGAVIGNGLPGAIGRGEGAVVIRNHQGVLAERGAGDVAVVFEPVEQAFFGQQPGDEGVVGLVVLGGDAAPAVNTRVGQGPAPGGGQARGLLTLAALLRAAGLVIGEDVFDDGHDGHVAEDIAVGALGEIAQPR